MNVASSLRARHGDVVEAGQVVDVRTATPRDDCFLRDLLADPCGGVLLMPIDVREMLGDLDFRDQRRALAAAHPSATVEIIELDGVDVGRLVCEREPGRVHVVDLTVHRDGRRRGIASAVLRALKGQDRSVTLILAPNDRPMLALCRQLGFVPSSVDPDGAVTMRHALAAAVRG